MARPRKFATTSEAEIRALAAEGLNFVQMAERLNVPVIALRNCASLLGIKSGRGQENSMPLQEWIDALADGKTLREIGAKHGLGVKPQAIHNNLARRGLPTNKCAARIFKELQAHKAAQASQQAGA